jgi:hypothetical protein
LQNEKEKEGYVLSGILTYDEKKQLEIVIDLSWGHDDDDGWICGCWGWMLVDDLGRVVLQRKS